MADMPRYIQALYDHWNADLSSLPSIDSYPPLDLSREHVSKTWEHLEYMAASPRIDNSSPHDQSFDPSVTRESTSAPTKIALRAEKDLIRILPPIDVARQLFEHYVEAVDCMDRFIHVPSTRDLLEATYAGLPSSVPARETLIFFVCIFASGSYYVCRVHDHRVTDQLSREHARSAAWVERALHEVMRPDTMYSSSVMSLQSSFIVLLLLLDFEGQSKRYHVLKSIIHTRAIQMKLHKTDMEAQEKDLDFIEAEIKRRLWWYLVGTDWLHGNVAGPQEGTYTINPQHMATELPGNIDDKNLSTDVPPVSRELHQPTSMSFFLQRIEVAKLSRESVDLLQNIGSSISSSYPLILRVTEKYTSLLSSLPPFFQSHNEDFSSQEVISRDRPYISRQRAILLYGLYSRLGRLHRPFMTLGITDKTFEISHQMGIHCAKMILELRNSMAEEDMCLFGRSHSVDQHSFIALVLLSIDIIARPDQEGVEAQRSEIMNTCRTLINKYQPGGQSSGGITRAIELLLDILHKSKQSTLVPGAFASPTRPTPRSASREFPTTANIQPEDAMASLTLLIKCLG
ncbi:hypothetical protein N7470_006691 [Penicillium chermesinum]|nr:hypothetical protein N7470_006691 [Penicillium chermesinum]